MNNESNRLLDIVSMSKTYCETCQEATQYTKSEFTDRMLDLLPRIYWNFFDLEAGVALGESDFFSDYVDEDMYEEVRRRIATVMGGSDIFLETFEEDMKYSETPISASVSEGLADIYQPLFNFISIVHDSEGEQMHEAFLSCKEDFESYWSQTLCNVLRALNNIKYGITREEEL